MTETPYRYRFAYLWSFLTPVYDMFRWIGARKLLQDKLWPQVKIKPGSRFLDCGCGTGDDLIYLATHFAGLNLFGIDGDADVLAIAKKKIRQKKLSINLQVSLAEKLPFADNSFDVVWSSLMVHHLPTEYKIKAIREMRRVLKTGYQLYLVEFSQIKSFWVRTLFWIQTKFEPVGDHYAGKLPGYIAQAGFKNLREAKLRFNISLFKAVK